MRVLVFSHAHPQLPWMSSFPHVRGHVLAKALRALDVDAEFRALPITGHWDVAIFADYQREASWVATIGERLDGLTARRMFCLADSGTVGHASQAMGEWFGQRGGVLRHLRDEPLAPYEHYVGVGAESVYDATASRDAILFDFPRSDNRDASADFSPARLEGVRRSYPGYRLLGTGPADSTIRAAFDQWIAYGQPHDEYVRLFTRCLAFVPGWSESLGLAVAEAQLAGAAIVSTPGWVRAEMLVPAAAILDDDLVRGLARARRGDPARIATEAAERFSPAAMAQRVMAAIRAVG